MFLSTAGTLTLEAVEGFGLVTVGLNDCRVTTGDDSFSFGVIFEVDLSSDLATIGCSDSTRIGLSGTAASAFGARRLGPFARPLVM